MFIRNFEYQTRLLPYMIMHVPEPSSENRQDFEDALCQRDQGCLAKTKKGEISHY